MNCATRDFQQHFNLLILGRSLLCLCLIRQSEESVLLIRLGSSEGDLQAALDEKTEEAGRIDDANKILEASIKEWAMQAAVSLYDVALSHVFLHRRIKTRIRCNLIEF